MTPKQRAVAMAKAEPSKSHEYYSLSLTALEDGSIAWGAYTHFTGWHDVNRRVELRAPSIIRAKRIASTLRDKMGLTCLVVDEPADLFLYLLLGGDALVRRQLVETHLPQVLTPKPAVTTGFFGFTSLSALPGTALNRAPTKKLRMAVLTRDDFRCRICGRRAADNSDITLNVHHIRLWSDGGATHEDNLITLCHTCHEGLDPHHNPRLFELLPVPETRVLGRDHKEHLAAIARYRKVSAAAYQKAIKARSSTE